jgi:ribonuclease HI
MALAGATEALRLLAGKGARLRVLIVSDSQYLVKGMREWVSGWAARGWRRKDGPIENVELWQELVASARLHDVQWSWVRGHRGHPKNEYANDLAVLAARDQRASAGLGDSGYYEWLAGKMARGLFVDYDRDADFAALERKLLAGAAVPLVL